jgi:hypothetical protein
MSGRRVELLIFPDDLVVNFGNIGTSRNLDRVAALKPTTARGEKYGAACGSRASLCYVAGCFGVHSAGKLSSKSLVTN